jgi:hypothetical protein
MYDRGRILSQDKAITMMQNFCRLKVIIATYIPIIMDDHQALAIG